MNFVRMVIKKKEFEEKIIIVPYFSNGRRAALSIFPSRTDAAVVPRLLEAVAL